MWAEKELHNLVKMSRHGLRVPDAVLLKKHVLLMSFIGNKVNECKVYITTIEMIAFWTQQLYLSTILC